MRVIVTPIVFGAFGMITKGLVGGVGLDWNWKSEEAFRPQHCKNRLKYPGEFWRSEKTWHPSESIERLPAYGGGKTHKEW